MTGTPGIAGTFLGSVPLLEGFSPIHIEHLARGSRIRVVNKGDFIFFQGDDAKTVYFVRSGWVVIMLTSSDGRELVLSELHPYGLFGENAILTNTQRSATAVAQEQTELIEVTGEAFMAVMDADPRLARRLLDRAVARLVAGNERESALAFLHAGARVARVLHLLDDMDRRTADKGYVTISQDELAQRTGLTRQTVARFLGRWRRQGWLLTGRGRIMLLNRDALFELEHETLN